MFSGLSAEERQLICDRAEVQEYKKGQIIYPEGSPADAFYCLVLGRIVIYTTDVNGKETALEYLHRGKYFGIISLLTGDSHSVTAKAINDCLILLIKKDDFNFLLKKIPQLAIDLSQTLSRRLKNKDLHQKTIFESTLVSVFSSYSQAGKTVYALNLALSLKKETNKSIIILDICPQEKIHSLASRLQIKEDYRILDLSSATVDALRLAKEFIVRDKFGIDLLFFHYHPGEESGVKKLMGILSLLVNDYHYIVLDLPSLMDDFVFKTLNQTDLIHLLTSPQPVDITKTRHLIEKLKEEFHFPEAKIKVIINEYKLARIPPEEQAAILQYPIFATLPKIEFKASDRLALDEPESEYAKAVRRIARQVGERLVGLALGVGVGYGFCHIGVLRVIEEENIPIDVISGSSIGAVIASLWAVGIPAKEILKITQEEFKEPKKLWGLVDLTLSFSGFVKGKKLYNFLKKYLGNKTFYDIKLPLKIVASDIRRKEPKVFDQGSLLDALMNSCCMPGVFQPFRFREGIILDGGVISPLPTEILYKMGMRKIIAVNVTPVRSDMLKYYDKIKAELSSVSQVVKKRQWFNLKQYFQEKFKTNFLEIIFSSIEVMQSELIEKESQLADIVLHPDTQGLHWLELHRAEEFAKRGEEETRRKLDKIWKVINE